MELQHLPAKESLSLPTLALPLSDVYCHVKIENDIFFEDMKASVAEHGMLFPIVVWHISIEEWKRLREANPSILPPPPFEDNTTKVYQIRCGNNRARVAKALGFTSIDCIQVFKPKEANDLCYRMRERMNQLRGSTQMGRFR